MKVGHEKRNDETKDAISIVPTDTTRQDDLKHDISTATTPEDDTKHHATSVVQKDTATKIDGNKEPEISVDTTTKIECKFWAKIVLKACITGYDLYTDIALAIEWINPYHVIMQNGESCSIYGNEAFGYVLLILSSIGFICGICSFISSFIHHKTRHKERKKKFEGCEISMQLFKILIEDIGSLIICLTVYIINGNASDAFYRSYFTSIASMFFSSARNLWTRPCVCKRDGRSWLKDGCLFYQCHCDAYCKIASDYAGNQWTMLGILAPIMALPFLLLEASLLTKQGYKMYWINGECLQPLVTSTGSVSDDALAEYWSMQTVTSAGNYTVTCDAKDSFTNLCDPLFENDLWCMSSQPLVECYVVSENGQYCTVAMAINECTGNRDCFLDEHFTACICVLQL
eukprot:34510_1